MYSCETQVQRKFKRAYGAYELRNRNITLLDYQVKLLDQLSSLLSLTRMSLQEDLLESRFALAEAASEWYSQSDNPKTFQGEFERFANTDLIEEGNALTIGCNVISVGENEVSPIEAIQATARNLAIVREFTSPVENLADGMLLSGTNAWGAFYAVRGDSNFEKGKGEPSRASDIDLLITSQSIDRLGDILQRYISLGLVDESESKRFLVFKDLYTNKKADMFSVRSNYGGVEESLHFIPMDVIDTICNLEPVADSSKSGFDLDFLNDFRTTIPGNVRKYGGYPTGDLKGLRVESFVPIPQEIKYPGTNEVAGYITQNPVGGPKVVDGQQTYFMGVIPFFLTISPKLLIDKDNLLSRRITMLRSNIRTIMNDQEIQYIPRQERMPRRTRELVLQSFHD